MGPAYVGSQAFLDPFEIIAALIPVDTADIRKRFMCQILCHVEKGEITGDDSVAFARFKRLFEEKSREEKAQFYARIAEQLTGALKQKADIGQYYAQAKAQTAWKVSYSPPKTANPRTSSFAPVEVIRESEFEHSVSTMSCTTTP